MEQFNIPRIDFSKYGLHVTDASTVPDGQLKCLAEEFNKALSTVGYLVLTNHGVPQQLVDDTFAATRNFFDLPPDIKSQYEEDGSLHGWMRLGRESLDPNTPSEQREAFISRVGKSDDGQEMTRSWPSDVTAPQFKEYMVELFNQSLQLSRRVLEVLAIALGVKDRALFARSFERAGLEGGQCGLLANFYPPVLDGSSDSYRLGAHTDYGLISLVYQATCAGLEFYHAKDKKWISVPPTDGGVILHIADLMQRWSADAFHSVLHRVVIPDDPELKMRARQSLIFFGDCDGDTVVTCYDGSDKYPPVRAREYVEGKVREAQMNALKNGY